MDRPRKTHALVDTEGVFGRYPAQFFCHLAYNEHRNLSGVISGTDMLTNGGGGKAVPLPAPIPKAAAPRLEMGSWRSRRVPPCVMHRRDHICRRHAQHFRRDIVAAKCDRVEQRRKGDFRIIVKPRGPRRSQIGIWRKWLAPAARTSAWASTRLRAALGGIRALVLFILKSAEDAGCRKRSDKAFSRGLRTSEESIIYDVTGDIRLPLRCP